MDIKKVLEEQYLSISRNEKELSKMFTDIIKFLNNKNNDYVNYLSSKEFFEESKLDQREFEINTKQIEDELINNMNFAIKLLRSDEYFKLEKELKELKERAKIQIDEAKLETEKARKSAVMNTQRKLQIARDRIIGTTNSVVMLSELINESSSKQDMEASINNILLGVIEIAKEMDKLDLWGLEELPVNQKIILDKKVLDDLTNKEEVISIEIQQNDDSNNKSEKKQPHKTKSKKKSNNTGIENVEQLHIGEIEKMEEIKKNEETEDNEKIKEMEETKEMEEIKKIKE